MRELATRLQLAGIPHTSEVEGKKCGTVCHSPSSRSVERVIKSLTRMEGNVLLQMLLTPKNSIGNHDSVYSCLSVFEVFLTIVIGLINQ